MIIRGDRDNLEAKAAWILAENIQFLLTSQKHVVLAVPGGRSAGGVFQCLARENVDWERVHIFLLDERLFPPGHPGCNFTQVREQLREIAFPASFHPFPFNPGQAAKGLDIYRRELTALGGRFDIVLMSSGEDGHVAGLLPGLHDPVADVDDFLLVHDAHNAPAERMTASMRLLLRAQTGILLLFGREKKAALRYLVDTNLTLRDCPAKIVGLLPQHYILTDQQTST